MSAEDARTEAADQLVFRFQGEYEANLSRRMAHLEAVDIERDNVRDAVLFAMDHGWKPPTELTPSQKAALAGEGGLFSPQVGQDADRRDTYRWVEFFDDDGFKAPFSIAVWWSSVTPALPVISIDSDEDAPVTQGGSPILRITLNDDDVYERTATNV